MKSQSLGRFYGKLLNKRQQYPWSGQIELTYRCNLNCVHCYCKGSENKNKELTTQEWKRILDEIHKEGCVWLVFTGGEPLIREDFTEIYLYAKRRGFIINIFTNGLLLTEERIEFFQKYPPRSIEITLNGITQDTYEAITQTEGSFSKVMKTIKILAEKKLPLILKTNCLKQNKDEVGKIKKWAEELLGKPSDDKYYFKYDPMIYPRLNGNKTPTRHRLTPEEILEAKRQDSDIWQGYQEGLHRDFPELKRDKSFLYHCNSWMSGFFINPFGRLQFCHYSNEFSVDLKTTSFREGFYEVFPKVLNEKFKTNSKCKDCQLRPICYHCPARAYLETDDEEAPVPYFCELAKFCSREKLAAGVRPEL